MNTSGDPNSPILLIGESWGKHEEADPNHEPFIGPSGWELNRMLAEAGFSRGDCFVCNVANGRPPGDKVEHYFYTKTDGAKGGVAPRFGLYPNDLVRTGLDQLNAILDRQRPKLVLPLGAVALWALTEGKLRRPDEHGKQPTGILRWRGSELRVDRGQLDTFNAVPLVHPAAILREWAFRSITIRDLYRARRVLDSGIHPPEWNFILRPSFRRVMEFIEYAKEVRRRGEPIAVDIETRAGQIACVGLATSKLEALCIPFMCIGLPEGYWTIDEELAVILKLRELLEPAGAPVVFQNGAYDLQYFAKQFGWIPAASDDTMLMQHLLFPGLKKGLDFLSSMYCEYHRYWKDDGKNFDPRYDNEERLWGYNCEDCVRTLEIYGVLADLISRAGRTEHYLFQMRLFKSALRMMLRGVRIDTAAKKQMIERLGKLQDSTEDWLNRALGREFNCRSNKQMTELFYDEMGCKPIHKRDSNGYHLTCDEGALDKLKRREPLLKPIIEKIEEFRSIAIFKKNYAEMTLPPDGRMRSTVNLAGTETYRLSMSEDAFSFGGNLQTLPKGTEDD